MNGWNTLSLNYIKYLVYVYAKPYTIILFKGIISKMRQNYGQRLASGGFKMYNLKASIRVIGSTTVTFIKHRELLQVYQVRLPK